MKFYFDHYGKKEGNFAQITITDCEYDEKIDVINIESIDEKEFKKLYDYLTVDEAFLYIFDGDSKMIGSENRRKQIKDILIDIAHNNNQKYGHIDSYADLNRTRILLGFVKDQGEKDIHKQAVYFDILYGFIEDESGHDMNIMDYDFFELSDSFEEDMDTKIHEIEKAFDRVTDEERKSIRRLKKIRDK